MELSKRKETNDEGVSNAAEPATSSTNKFLSSMGGRVFKANEAFATTHGEDTLLGVWTAIFLTWIVVHSLVYVVVQYGFFKGTQQYLGEGTFPNYFVPRNLTPEAACLSGLKNSGFDSLDSSLENVEKWMDESTVVDVPKTGIWIGPVDFSEYLKYLKHPKYFQGYKHSSPLEITPVKTSPL